MYWSCAVYVVVNFLFQVIFVFLLFWGMVIYANEVETKKIKITGDKKLTTTYISLVFINILPLNLSLKF